MAAETLHESLRAELTAERERVLEQLANLGIDAGTFDENFADSGQVTAERGEVEALSGSLLDALHDVDHALAKLDAETFGSCEECGRPIGEARLEAMPAARLCIECASHAR
jgi:DnaK suppressor protein